MEITKKERERLIKQISNASGVAQYALKEKMTDEQVIQASQNLGRVLKPTAKPRSKGELLRW
ncbi:hypothetical protein IFO70_39900 [Phormidium tenue FACHB-886]|nr:hypothetical protein [Phormidium tenue FACHB-886]